MARTPFYSQVLFPVSFSSCVIQRVCEGIERSEASLARSFTGEEAGGRSRRQVRVLGHITKARALAFCVIPSLCHSERSEESRILPLAALHIYRSGEPVV